MCFLSVVWKVSLDILVSQSAATFYISHNINIRLIKLDVWFDAWFDDSVIMSHAMPNLKNTTNPQLCMLIPERKYTTLQRMGVLLKLHGCLTTKLNRATCGYFKSSHKTLLVVILWVLSFSLSLTCTCTHTHTHTSTSHYQQYRHSPPPTMVFFILMFYLLILL